MRVSLGWDVFFVMEHDDLRRAHDIEHYRLARQLRRTLITMDRDYLDDRVFPPLETSGVLVLSAPNQRGLERLLDARRSRHLSTSRQASSCPAARRDQAAGVSGVRGGARVMAAGVEGARAALLQRQ